METASYGISSRITLAFALSNLAIFERKRDFLVRILLVVSPINMLILFAEKPA
jgi:hypothetical protein